MYYVCIMYALCMYYVCIMYVLCIYYVCIMYVFIVTRQLFSLGGMQSKPNGSLEYIILVFCLLLSFDVYSSTVRFKLNFGQELCSFYRLNIMCLLYDVFPYFFNVLCILYFHVVLYFEISFKDIRFVHHSRVGF